MNRKTQAQGGSHASALVIVVGGPGGVGKTTTAASIALACSERGFRSVVVTVDPAKRLADALGIAELNNSPTAVSSNFVEPGSLSAMMLDPGATFDDLILRYAPNPERAQRILGNTFYRNVSRALSGTQEYMAMEKLFELATEPKDANGEPLEAFDVIVVDTPPTSNALDLLNASDRLTRLLDNKVFRALMKAQGLGLRTFGNAIKLGLRPIAKLIGTAALDDAVEFFQNFEGMEAGFRERSRLAKRLFTGPESKWVVVCGAQRATVKDAKRLMDALAANNVSVSEVLANRIAPLFEPLPDQSATVDAAMRRTIARLDSANAIARSQRSLVSSLVTDNKSGITLNFSPLWASEVQSLNGIKAFAQVLGPMVDRLLAAKVAASNYPLVRA